MGFDRNTPAHLYTDLMALAATAGKSPETIGAALMVEGVGFWVGLAALVLLIGAGIAVERTGPRWWRRIWVALAVIRRHGPIWRGLVAVIRQAAIPLVALGCWTVGVSLADGETESTVLVQLLLSDWCIYRLLDEAARQVVRHAPTGSEVGTLLPAFHRLLLFAALWVAVWLGGDRLAYRADVVSLWVALGHLLLVLGIFNLLRQRDRILSLLPASGNRAYLAFRRFLVAIYYPLVYFSLVVSLLWVAGYRNMGAIVLARSWAVAGICILGMGLYRASRRLIERWTPPDPEQPALREGVITAREHLIAAVLLLVAVSSISQVLGLTDPLAHWSRLAWLSVGSLRITGMGLWTSALVVMGMLLLSRWLQTTLAYRLYPRLGVGTGEAYALNRLLHYTMAAGSILLVLNSLGISPSSLALVVGGLSVGIGFGLQDIAKNIASGLILLTSRQVRQGDVISVGDQMGMVRDVNLRSTLVTNADNVDLLIPNAKLLGDTLVNWTYSSPTVRVRVPFGAAAAADPEQVIKETIRIARSLTEVLETPAPDVQLVELGEKTHKYELLVWVELRDSSVRARVISELYRRILETLPTLGIDIPVTR